MKFVTSMMVAFAIVSATTFVHAQTVTVTGGEIRGAIREKGGATGSWMRDMPSDYLTVG